MEWNKIKGHERTNTEEAAAAAAALFLDKRKPGAGRPSNQNFESKYNPT